jgi:uncharacterized membrane protein YbhN (UPF0104 family)
LALGDVYVAFTQPGGLGWYEAAPLALVVAVEGTKASVVVVVEGTRALAIQP